MRRIGLLMSLPQNDPHEQALMGAFVRGMRDLGWTEGRNFRIDFRATEGRIENLQPKASELIASRGRA